MPDPCARCEKRTGCDFLANWCLLSPSEIARKPELIGTGRFDATERLRKQKREHNARARQKRRDEARVLRLMFSRLLAEYGTFGKHSKLMRDVKATANAPAQTVR